MPFVKFPQLYSIKAFFSCRFESEGRMELSLSFSVSKQDLRHPPLVPLMDLFHSIISILFIGIEKKKWYFIESFETRSVDSNSVASKKKRYLHYGKIKGMKRCMKNENKKSKQTNKHVYEMCESIENDNFIIHQVRTMDRCHLYQRWFYLTVYPQSK